MKKQSTQWLRVGAGGSLDDVPLFRVSVEQAAIRYRVLFVKLVAGIANNVCPV